MRAFVGLGSNRDGPAGQVGAALTALDALDGASLTRRSSLYATAPWGVTDQPDFINAVAELETDLSAPDLLDRLLAIEDAAGRRRDGRRWGARVLDLDLLLYGKQSIRTDRLTVPHPYLHERAFVLVPLLEIAPDVRVPGLGRAAGLLERVDASGVRKLESDS